MSTDADTAAAKRAFVAELVAERRHPDFSRCVYCGAPCYGLTCKGHRELLWNDPNYREARVRS